MSRITQLNGKPFVIKLDGRVRNIGEVANAVINPGRTVLDISITITDEEIAGILGAAADKGEREESPVGMSLAEIDAIIDADLPDPGPLVQKVSLEAQDRALGKVLEAVRNA